MFDAFKKKKEKKQLGKRMTRKRQVPRWCDACGRPAPHGIIS
jgi:hypothetical protein